MPLQYHLLQKLMVKLDWSNVITAKNLQYIHIRNHIIEFKKKPCTTRFCLTALQPYLRPTSHRCMGPVFSHSAGDGCIITNMLFW